MVRPHLVVFWLKKDDSTGHSEKKVDRCRGVKKIYRRGQGLNFASSARVAKDTPE